MGCAGTGASHNSPKTSVKDSTKFLGFLGGLLRQSIRCEDQTAQNLVTAHFPVCKQVL